MNFTREPIIETIITPKEGHKLLVRNTKGNNAEEYIVEALEVVSFGHSFFFRSLERPKSFLVPVSDYEVSETKETRVVLKNASFERNIKIGGGAKKEKAVEPEEQEPAVVEQRLEKKRERRRHRRRRSSTTEETKDQPEETKTTEKPVAEGGGADDETQVSSSIVKRLIPPPPGLISESITKAKAEDASKAERDVLPELKDEEKPKRTRKKKDEEKPEDKEPKEEEDKKSDDKPPAEGGETNRIAAEAPEMVTSTSFSALRENSPFGKIW